MIHQNKKKGSHNIPKECVLPKRDFEAIGTRIGRLVAEKNARYGNSFVDCGEILKILYPDGIKPDQMVDALLVVRIVDKLFRIANRKDLLGESAFVDLAGYGICGASLYE